VPNGVIIMPVAQDAGEHIVTIGEAVGLDDDTVTDDALDSEPPLIHVRRYSFDDGAHAAVPRQRHRVERGLSCGHRVNAPRA
jgi:hypothetical protein